MHLNIILSTRKGNSLLAFTISDPGNPCYVANRASANVGEHGGIYNRAGREFPDDNANGANFRVFNNGTGAHSFGTSLAAPLWAAVVNQDRQTVGKGPVGFLNPALYAHPSTQADIGHGPNPNCGSSGFAAVEG
ncbi:hypothetical protein F5X99DRAFT_413760 [Biscogniauxia marginata]|nr:hypothetical protein F5X99DRAFT_413760 [Biscogniauxia marginata]